MIVLVVFFYPRQLYSSIQAYIVIYVQHWLHFSPVYHTIILLFRNLYQYQSLRDLGIIRIYIRYFKRVSYLYCYIFPILLIILYHVCYWLKRNLTWEARQFLIHRAWFMLLIARMFDGLVLFLISIVVIIIIQSSEGFISLLTVLLTAYRHLGNLLFNVWKPRSILLFPLIVLHSR